MNKNVLIVLAGGFIIAVLVAVLVQAGLKGSKKEEVAKGDAKIIVASKDLKVGHELKDGDLKWQSWPEGSIFSGAVVREDNADIEDVMTGRLSVAVSKGQPVLKSFVLKEDDGNFMAASLRPGMRAVGISVKAHTMAGGFIGPGDSVDVLVTYKVKIRDRDNPEVQSKVNQFVTETILQNVRVLAIDQQSTREEDKAKVARTVTLEVDAEGAEKMALATEMGDIRLSLRGIGEEADKSARKVTTDVEMSRILKDLARMQGGSGGSSGIVRVYNGNAVQNVPVRQPLPPIEP